MTEDEIIKGIRAPGKFDAGVGSEADAVRVVRSALPHAAELPPAIAGQPYPCPAIGVKAWFQAQPAEPSVGNDAPCEVCRLDRGQEGPRWHVGPHFLSTFRRIMNRSRFG
jgi:hypothetical protein